MRYSTHVKKFYEQDQNDYEKRLNQNTHNHGDFTTYHDEALLNGENNKTPMVEQITEVQSTIEQTPVRTSGRVPEKLKVYVIG